MAEVVKKKENTELYDLKKNNKSVKEEKTSQKSNKNKKKSNFSKKNKSLLDKFMIFCHGVKSETKKIHWTTKQELIKYSIATVFFIVFSALFCFLIEIIFAFAQSLVG